MKKKLLYLALILIIVIGAGGKLLGSFFSSSQTEFEFTDVKRGTLESIISSSGTLTPVTTVDVGTQVSGTIDKVYIDYNDVVKEGQLLAILDTTMLKASVLDAEAGLERAEAQFEEAETEYNRAVSLYNRKLIAESDYNVTKSSYKSAKADVKSAEAGLTRAKQNLDYAYITSPINGIVIGKDIEEGQTVAASLAAPTMFTIAQDLSDMEILVDVDESDIGSIKLGQLARFEVQAYDNKVFTGTVKQIRLQPTMTSNVVNYTVVVAATNEDDLLLPGMTATVDFVIEQHKDILYVSKTALRFTPTEDMLKQLQQTMQNDFANITEDERAAMNEQRKNTPAPGAPPENAGMLWYKDASGTVQAQPVLTGFSDSKYIEIEQAGNIAEGTMVISGIDESGGTTTEEERGGLFGGPGGGGPPPPGGF
ncbi:MAG: efflux RND transporter periplasmic adaptor subunit [Candidatus Zixiibacteriota bacterium]